jgi:GT2 family glycosyltransferase
MSKLTTELVSLIIPTLSRSKLTSLKTLVRNRFLLKDTIAAIKRNVHCRYEIIVVCNEVEHHGFIQSITGNRDIDKFCLNSVNIGVPRSWNMGAQLAEGEFLCYVNDDVEIGIGDIERMVDVISQPDVGEVGPRGTKWFRQEPGPYVGEREITEADAISGWLFMIKRSAFDAVGGFDIAYTPAFCEEIDISFAIRAAGYRCLVIPGLKAVHHHISGASSTNRPLKAFGMEIGREELTARNRAYFEKKWERFW